MADDERLLAGRRPAPFVAAGASRRAAPVAAGSRLGTARVRIVPGTDSFRRRLAGSGGGRRRSADARVAAREVDAYAVVDRFAPRMCDRSVWRDSLKLFFLKLFTFKKL